MLTTSTHDTKRSEDVRARIAVLSELPARWEVGGCSRPARCAGRRGARPQPPFDPSVVYLALQTVVRAPGPSDAPADVGRV